MDSSYVCASNPPYIESGLRPWPAFNIADSAITLGVALMLAESFGLGSSKKSPS